MHMEQGLQDAAGYRWTFAQAQFDESRWELSVDGVPVELERKPLELLAHLLRHAGEVLTKDELLESVWTGRIVVEAALTNAVGKLRKALGDEAQTLIVTVPRVGYRLDGPVSRKAVQALPPASMLAAGDAVPRRPNYRLLERLARNEDSEVWRAEQPKSHETRVFKFSLDGARLPGLKREVTLSRLLRDALGEREDLVRVLDWDFEQAPYFIESEYGGSSLDSWFGQHGDATDRSQRLALIAEIADAVASAHEVGVLHKDLKPANILVYGEAENWRPRLTDFGSGRVLDAGRLEALGITQLGLTRTQTMSSDSHSGTPLYLAPEVIAGQSPSIKSDLYALGVILYQFLAGDFRRPMSPGWEQDIDDPVLRQDIAAFANGDPARRPPSARDVAERLRNLDARRVRLDVEQAVQARIADSERKLGLVRARRPWIAAAMLLLVAGLTGSLFYAGRAERARVQATIASAEAIAAESKTAAASAQAERQLARANSVNAFLVQDVIGAADPFKTGEQSLSINDALKFAEKNISVRFKDEPRAQAQVRIMLGQAYSGRGDHAAASDQYAQASAAIGNSAERGDRETALQARLHQAGTLLNLGDLPGFDQVMQAVLKAVESDPKLEPKLRLHAHFVAGQKAMLTGDAQGAVAQLDKAHAILTTMPAPDPALALRVESVLGMMLAQAGDSARAVELLEEAQKRALATYGPRHPEAINVRILLGLSLNRRTRFADATRHLLALKRDVIAAQGAGSEPALDVDQLLAEAYAGQGDLDAAGPLYQSAYQRRLALSGAANPQTLDLAAAAAAAMRRWGRGAQALAIIGPALQAAVQLPAPNPAAEKLRFVQACTLYGTGDRAGADRVAASLQPQVLRAADPTTDWPRRVSQLRDAIRSRASGDPCVASAATS